MIRMPLHQLHHTTKYAAFDYYEDELTKEWDRGVDSIHIDKICAGDFSQKHKQPRQRYNTH